MIRPLVVFILLILIPLTTNSQETSTLEELQEKFDKVLFQDFRQAEKFATQLDTLSSKSSDQDQIIQALSNLIRLNLMKKDYDTAESYLQRIRVLGEKNLTPEQKIDFYNYNAILENIALKFDVSIQYSEEAEKLALELQDSIKIAESILSKVKIFIGQKDLEKAKKQLSRSLKYLKYQKNSELIEDTYFAYGRSYYLRDMDSALFYFNESIASAKLKNNLYKQIEAYSDIAYTYIYHEQPEKAKKPLLISMDLTQQVGHNSLFHNNYYIYGMYYESIGEYESAIVNYKKAINDYGVFVHSVQLSNAYLMLSSAYYHKNDFKNAHDYQEIFMILKDSIYNVQKSKEFENIRTQYEVERKDNQITLLEKENELATTRRNWLISLGLLLSTILTSLFLFYRQRARSQYRIREQEKDLHEKETERLKKEQELKQIQRYIEGQEKEKNRIAVELHDGIASELAGVHHLLHSVNADKDQDDLKIASAQVSRLAKNIRTLSHHLSSHYTQNKSLVQLLSELKRSYEHVEQFSVDITVFPPKDFDKISDELKHQLYRIIQELLKNVQKHADADHIIISLTKREDGISLVFEDDGKGFSLEDTTQGIGLQNIQERVKNIQGNLHIDTAVGKGTSMMIEIPN